MTIKTCTCGCVITTKNVKPLGKRDWGEKIMWFFNCVFCNSTHVMGSKHKEKKVV